MCGAVDVVTLSRHYMDVGWRKSMVCMACTALPYHEDGLALVTSEGLET